MHIKFGIPLQTKTKLMNTKITDQKVQQSKKHGVTNQKSDCPSFQKKQGGNIKQAHASPRMHAGEGWEQFNMPHVHSRMNMVQLYGNKKWLFRQSQLFGAAAQHALPAIFGIQVKD